MNGSGGTFARRHRRWVLALSLALGCVFVAGGGAGAQVSFLCPSASRTVLNAAALDTAIDCYNAQTPAGAHTITFGSDISHSSGAPTIAPAGGAGDLTIVGAGFELSGPAAGADDLLQIDTGSAITTRIEDLTLSDAGNDAVQADGGTVALSNVVLQFSGGAGLHLPVGSTAEVTVEVATLASNGGTAGLVVADGSVIAHRSLFRNNGLDGAAVLGGSLSMVNSTVADNDDDGIYVSDGALSLLSTTVATNVDDGLFQFSGSLTVGSSVFDDPCQLVAGPTVVDLGSNFGPASCGPGFTALSPGSLDGNLADNDCATPCAQSLELLHTSNAVTGGDCNLPGEPVSIDQRGIERRAVCDAGSFERLPGLRLYSGFNSCYNSRAPGEGTFVGGETRTVQITGAVIGLGGTGCVPDGATAVRFTVWSIDPLTEGNLRMTPAGVAATGGAGVVNYGAQNQLNNANAVIVPLSADGAVDIQANAGPAGAVPTTDVRLVATGYYSPRVDSDLTFFPLNPCAVADSRPNKGADDAFDGPNDDGYWPAGSSLPDVHVLDLFFPQGQGGYPDPFPGCGVPRSADAVLVNVVTIAPQNGPGHVSIASPGIVLGRHEVVAFAPLVPVGSGGFNNGATAAVLLDGHPSISLAIHGDDPSARTRVRVEVLGYYDDFGGGLAYSSVPPCAAFDSRPNKGAVGAFAGNRLHGPSNATTYQISGDELSIAQGGVVESGTGSGTGTCGVPDSAEAVLINFEAVNALQEGNLWVAAATATAGADTTGGVLNFNNVTPKMNNANAVVVPLSADGKIDVEVNAGSFTAAGTAITQVRGVILGYYS